MKKPVHNQKPSFSIFEDNYHKAVEYAAQKGMTVDGALNYALEYFVESAGMIPGRIKAGTQLYPGSNLVN